MNTSPETLPANVSPSILHSKPRFLAVKFPPPKSIHVLEKPEFSEDQMSSSKPMIKNIFSITKMIGEEYEMTSRGPKLTDKGVIIPYTILGRPEWFKNYQNSKENNVTIKENENKAQNSSISEFHEIQKVTRPMTSYVGSQNRSPFSIQNRPYSSKPFTERKTAEDSQKNLEKITIILKKEEVLDEINKIKGRVYRMKDNKKRQVPLSAKFFQNKEKNCLNHFDELEKKWEFQSKFYSKKISRIHNDKPLYDKGECFRQKLELAQVVDNLQTDHEKFGDRYWESTLRKYEENKKPEKKKDANRTLTDLKRESTFKKILENNDENIQKIRPLSAQIETIRNPKRQYNEMPFCSFKSDNYLKKKLQKFEEKVNEMHPRMKPEEINSFYVILLRKSPIF